MCDLECILNGSFTPLNGFLNKDDYDSVLHKLTLKDGSLWSIPIVCPFSIIESKELVSLNSLTTITLCNQYNTPIAELNIESVYKPDLELEWKLVLGTTDSNHPYIQEQMKWVDAYHTLYYIGGTVSLLNPIVHYDFKELRLSPNETKQYFKLNEWSSIVGFQTRNPMHRAHVELTKQSLREAGENSKLLIHPIVGVSQECDIDYSTRVRCYKHILKYYDSNSVLLSILPLNMRMAGPREALWHALIRQNYGCSHFIVGRDHAGPSTRQENGDAFYQPYEAHQLLESYKDQLDIKIITSKLLVYVPTLDSYMNHEDLTSDLIPCTISGTELRKRLISNELIPDWFSYPEIVKELRPRQSGLCIYLIGLSGSGKTTLANALKEYIQQYESRLITILDGDSVRQHLSRGLGFSRKDRSMNVRRIGFVASEIVKHGGIVICANIAPYEEDRLFNRKLISDYIEVWVNTSIEECERRDPKGLYKSARQGSLKNFTGIDDPFEIPQQCDLNLTESTVEQAIERIFRLIQTKLNL